MILFVSFLRISFISLLMAVSSNGENTTDRAEGTLQFINNVENKLHLTSAPNIILLIGNTGSGKSTLVHYVAGDYSKMISIEPTGDQIDYAIYDGLDPDIDRVSSTTVSRTLVPEMLIDESNFVWYDCPGFGDTRNTTVEIATTFLIKSVIENAQNTKIVLVVNHGSVVEGYDRSDFDKLITHTTQLVPNIARYVDSVSMVVTKVQPYAFIGRKSVDVSEQKVKRSVANFLGEYRKVLMEKGSSAKILLIDALLKQSPDGEFIRIAVFWRPEDAGSFDTLERMDKGRKVIRNMVLRQTIYTEIQRTDFGYPLTDTAQLEIGEMAQYAIGEIYRITSAVDQNTLNLLRGKIDLIGDFYERKETLETIDRIIVNEWISSAIDSISALSARIAALTSALNSTLPSDELRHIVRHEKNLNILQSIARFEIKVPINDYVSKCFADTFKYVKDERAWGTFLVNVYDFFVGYEVQKDVTLYNVRELADWKIRDKPQGLYVNKDNVKEFMEHFILNLDMEVNTYHLSELNQIIKFTLKSPPSIECIGDILTIKGNFLKSSDIQKAKCQSAVSKIRALVVSTFFVDSDLHLDTELEILTDKWVVMDSFTFHLDGKNGEGMPPPGNRGMAGRPGNVGSNGKNFFGLANGVVQGHLLTININGGNGGAGQDGSGNLVQRIELTDSRHQGWIGINDDVSIFYRQYLNNECHYAVNSYMAGDSWPRYSYLFWEGTYKTNYYGVYPYKCCGPIGLGGSGGLGGLAGQYRFITSKYVEQIPKFVAMNGENGAHGYNGASCDDSGVMVKVDTKDDIIPFYGIKLDSQIQFLYRINNPNCPNNFDISSIKAPEPSPIKPIQPTTSINEHKIFLRRKMMDVPWLESLGKSYDAIESNDDVNQMLTVEDLAVEMNALQKQSLELFGTLHFYVKLLPRIEDFCKSYHRNCTQSERQVLSLLYAHTLSKIALEDDKNADLMIDIGSYSRLFANNSNHLEQSEGMKGVSEYRDNIKVALDAKVIDTVDFIRNGIQKDIQFILRNLDHELQEIIEETLIMQINTLAGVKAADKRMQRIRQNIFLRNFVGILNVVQTFAAGFGSAGSTVVKMVDDTFDDNNISITQTTNNTLKLNQDVLRFIKKNCREKLKAFETELIALNQSLSSSNATIQLEFTEELSNLIPVVQEVMLQKSVELFHDKTDSLLERLRILINEQQKNLTEESDPAVECLRNTSNALFVIEASPSLYEQYSTDRGNIDIIGAAVNGDQSSLHKLRELEADTFSDLLPIFSAMLEYTSGATSNQKLSRGFCSKIQQKMQSVKKRVSDSISRLDLVSNAAVEDCIVKIYEAIDLIINIYDRIRKYEDQSILLLHLTELHSNSSPYIHIEDAQFKEILDGVQMNLQKNMFLAQYYRIVDGFNKAVFPLAAVIVDSRHLKAVSHVTSNKAEVRMSNVIENMKLMDERFNELRTAVDFEGEITMDFDNEVIIYGRYFDGEAGPFYTWQNNEIREQIRRLFAGEKVYLLADVRRSTKLNAVKFNSIGIEFRAANATLTTELEDILLPFYVTMTHMGDSHYRCGNQFYTINSPSQEIAYSFRRQSHTHSPMIRNAVYDKFSSSIALLSPYALWSVQLSNGQFDKLNPFVDLVDIELHGYGKYVGENTIVCRADLPHYYDSFY